MNYTIKNYSISDFVSSSNSESQHEQTIIDPSFSSYLNRNEINQNLQNSPLNNNYPNIPSSSYNDLTFQPWRPQDTF